MELRFLAENDQLLAPERKKWSEGFSFVAGVDEVGRGPLAGPVTAAAVVLPINTPIPALNDSKKLSDKQRRDIRNQLLQLPGLFYALVDITPEEIDFLNILGATHKAMRQAVTELKKVDFALIDGLPVPNFPIPNQSIVKGDSKSASIAAASILAKVSRDDFMLDLAKEYPEYGFENHKGYGTREHLDALMKFGPCPAHRRSFKPVRDSIDPPPEQGEFVF